MKKNVTAAAAIVASALAAVLSLSAMAPMALADECDTDCVPAPLLIPDPVDVPDPIDIPDPIDVPNPIDIPDPIPAPIDVDADGLDYGLEYDLLVPAVPYFDLTPCNGIVCNYLYAPTSTYVISASTAELIAQHVCRVSNASLVSTSAELFVHDAHGLCWSVEVRQAVGGGYQRVFYVTLDAVTGQPYAVKVVR